MAVSFTPVNATTAQTPYTVDFTDTSDGSPIAWLWNFGDGTTSNAQNPSHTFVDVGQYDVSLRPTLPASSGMRVQCPSFVAPTTTNANVVVASVGLVVVGSTLAFLQSSNLYQEYTITPNTAPCVRNGFTFEFNVTRQGGTGVDWAINLTIGGHDIAVWYRTSSFDSNYSDAFVVKDGATELLRQQGDGFFASGGSSLNVKLIITSGFNLEVKINGSTYATLTLIYDRSVTGTFLTRVYATSAALSGVPGFAGGHAATFTSFDFQSTAVAQAQYPTFTSYELITVTANSNPQLPPKVPTVYEHVQTAAASTWVIEHNLGRYPIVDIYVDYEGAKHRILPMNVEYTDPNTCTITFTQSYSGLATVS